MMPMTPRKFQQTVLAHFEKEGRHHLPWRQTTDPYKILVSEVMLQQTQVDRVIGYYERFLAQFPRVEALAKAPLGEVLKLWQGLGYNRRAKLLHECAKTVVQEYGGTFPRNYDLLRALPGIGPYTAGAIMAFAFNEAVPLIETNVRTVFIHHFFPAADTVTDRELMPLIEKTLDTDAPRQWYAALMDYGTHLKRTHGNASRRSAHHVKQSPFKGSDREVRGAMLRALSTKGVKEESLIKKLGFERTRVHRALASLEAEGLIVRSRGVYRLP